VRGYYESQVLGDHGVVGSVQGVTPDVLSASPELRFRVFADGAWLQTIDQIYTPPEGGNNQLITDDTSLASVGLGMDFALKKYVSAALEAGYALDDAVDIDKGDIRVDAALVVEF